MKIRGDRIPMITAYDYPSARLADSAGFPVILVGDSLGMVVLGFDSTIPVTVEHMVHHTAAVCRGSSSAQIVVDMPFMSYRLGVDETLRNAARLIQEGGAQAVKLEGGESVVEVKRIVDSGIPVMGHLGLTPQSVHRFGGYRVQGRAKEDARRLLVDALALEEAGAYSIVLELVPAPLARLITQRLSIPTIGIGAGPHCDGQVQVLHDILAFYPDFVPKHTRQYIDMNKTIVGALERYVDDVKKGSFPSADESFEMDEILLSDL
ncbi:3-methyl-2-oxobutanoate hydroxymethyltransferase [SAR202 cluster bacterium AD-804-J14_MRT_500m]|nr:3-methyl-2-oxobutanoate hydroxymethyltransferase [SAR202 cluster bacterium AD-804-J14_MRT_500m]